jgi:peptidoglycan/xylan/chitin deacetylase (PgdA/CDA1 family)
LCFVPEAQLIGISSMAMGSNGARTLFKRVRNYFFPGALILLYHRVHEPELDPQLLSVTRGNFEEHLKVLRQFCTVTLDSLLTPGQSKGFRIALTFDDGYADNLWNAKPLLEEYAVPATVFVSVGHVLNQRPYWWDELQELLLRSAPLPKTLSVAIGSERRQWSLGDLDTRQSACPRDPDWNVLSDLDPSRRHTVYRELCTVIKVLPPRQQEAVLDEIRSATSLKADGKSEVCSPEEIRRLREPGLIDIGAHTCTHPMLSQLPAGEQLQEISRSKELLEEIVGNPIEAFSYPYGGRFDYSQDTVDLVRRSGFRLACSNFEGHVRGSNDFYQLPRYLVRNWDGDIFARHLEKWLHA